jgi:hypothetical protein
MSTSDNEEYYNEPTSSDWAEYMRWREEYDRAKTDEELQRMCHYFEQEKQSITHQYYNPTNTKIEIPKLTPIDITNLKLKG